MKFHRYSLVRTLRITDKYYRLLSAAANVKLEKFVTVDQLKEICRYLENSSGNYRTLVLKDRIECFIASQRIDDV